MIIGVGIDMLEIERVQKLLDKGYARRVFTEEEYRQAEGSASKLAGDFSVKEAVAKSFGTGVVGFSIQDIEVLRDSQGKPYVVLYNGAKAKYEELGATNLQVSISNTKDLVIAYAVLERE